MEFKLKFSLEEIALLLEECGDFLDKIEKEDISDQDIDMTNIRTQIEQTVSYITLLSKIIVIYNHLPFTESDLISIKDIPENMRERLDYLIDRLGALQLYKSMLMKNTTHTQLPHAERSEISRATK